MHDNIKNYFHGNYQKFYKRYLPEVVKCGNDEYKARCPFHEDRNPSFFFNNLNGSFYCHGCKEKGHIADFYAKINGLDTKRDFPKILQGIANDFGIPLDDKKPQIVKTYDYTDPEGNLVHQTVRYEPKHFKQCRPDGKGKDIWNLKDIQLYLYRLPEVIKAQEVIIVEGEKDADTVASLGMCGTTAPMGAKSWLPEYSKWLKGKDVILIPDNDDEGREHMQRVASALQGVANSIKWVELPDLQLKGDASDWVEAVGDPEDALERLALMIERAEEYEPPKEKTLEDVIFLESDFITINLPRKETILAPWLYEQSISLISGGRGTGKTWFAMSIVDAITKNNQFGPWEVETPVPCLYLEGEMAAQDVQDRFHALNPSNAKRVCPLYIYSDAYANHLGYSRANLLSEEWRKDMKRILMDKGVKLWVVDNLASLTSGIDENSKQEWDPINAWLLELRFAGIATVLLHHTNKRGEQRGTSAREDNIDVSIELKTPHDYVPEDGAKFVVSFTKNRLGNTDLALIGDTQFHLRMDNNEQLTWTWGNFQRETKVEILRMLNEGCNPGAICDELGISKGYVSRIKKSAIRDGLLTPKGKLTPAGLIAVYGE